MPNLCLGVKLVREVKRVSSRGTPGYKWQDDHWSRLQALVFDLFRNIYFMGPYLRAVYSCVQLIFSCDRWVLVDPQ